MFVTRRSVFYVCCGVLIDVVSSIKKTSYFGLVFYLSFKKVFCFYHYHPFHLLLSLLLFEIIYPFHVFGFLFLVFGFRELVFLNSVFCFFVCLLFYFLFFLVISCSSFNYFPSHWKVRGVNRTLSNNFDGVFRQK